MEHHHFQWTNPLFRLGHFQFCKSHYQMGISHKITMKHHETTIFVRFSSGFPMVCLGFSHVQALAAQQRRPSLVRLRRRAKMFLDAETLGVPGKP